MKVIGVTGGVGAGKTQILSYIRQHYNCRVIFADEAAHLVKEPGGACYERLIALLGADVLSEDGQIDREKMAEKIFAHDQLREAVNALIHPAVKEYITDAVASERKAQKIDFLFIEAALLIEGGYCAIVDDMWYLYAPEDARRRRLRQNRHYTEEKIGKILSSQLLEAQYRAACGTVIDNSGTLPETYLQIDKKLAHYLQNDIRRDFTR